MSGFVREGGREGGERMEGGKGRGRERIERIERGKRKNRGFLIYLCLRYVKGGFVRASFNLILGKFY